MSIDSEEELLGLRRAGKAVAATLAALKLALRPGVTGLELDAVAAEVFARHGARSAPALSYGFPGTVLLSVNDAVVHGIPNERPLKPGDVVTIDVTAEVDGYIADAAVTVPLAPVSPRVQALCRCAEAAFGRAMRQARAGKRLAAIGRAVETEIGRWGFTVIPELYGHGTGRQIHEDPPVFNFYDPGDRTRLTEGLVLAVEPILCDGDGAIYDDEDGWTIRTADGSLAAHYEHTVVVTRGKPLLVTAA
jgi:methionyl aminopeptidase